MRTEIMSISLTFLKRGFLSFLLWRSQINSDAQTVTPAAPKMLPKICKKIENSCGMKYPKINAINKRILNNMIVFVVSLYP